MKSLRLILLFIFSLMMLTACSGAADKENNTETVKKDTTSTQEDSKTGAEETFTEQVSVQAGLGDTLTAFESEYGENKGNPAMGSFQGDYLLPIFLKNRAVDISVRFEATDQKTRTLEEAKQVASQFIPKDAQLEKESTPENDPSKITLSYHSDTIAKLFPDYKPAGKFVVILNYNEGNADTINSMNIGLGEMK